MRNYLLLSSLCLASATSAFSQSIEVTSAGVGIGTATPAPFDGGTRKVLHITGASNGALIRIQGVNVETEIGENNLRTASFIYNRGAYPMTFGTNGIERLRINADNGNVGIGIADPSEKLTVTGNGLIRGASFAAAGDASILYLGDSGHSIKSVWGEGVRLSTYQADNALCIQQSSGNVGIGTISPTQKLHVVGSVKATSFISATRSYADYIFSKDYKLPTLTEVEQHIAEKGHLPGIPSEKEAMANGMDLGDMQVKLLAQIEQLTLHMIAHQKAIDALQRENASLKSELKNVTKSE